MIRILKNGWQFYMYVCAYFYIYQYIPYFLHLVMEISITCFCLGTLGCAAYYFN